MKIRSTFIGLVATQIIAAGAIPIFDVLPEFLRAPAAVTESLRLDAGSTGAGEGWLARWLAFGGEGEVTIKLPNNTLTLPHRSASFPTYLPHYLTLPIHGRLVDITSLHPNTSSSSPAIGSPSQACPTSPSLPRWYPPKPPYTIALIERGACDFASKVLYAQSLGAAGVVVGDNKAYAGETDEEGRERRGLLTMFSPAGETEDVRVPSVFVSRASWLLLRDLLRDGVGSEPWSVQEGEWERQRDNGDEGGKQGQVEGDEEGGGGMNGKATLWIQLGEAKNEGGTLGNLLSFSLLMPTCFLIITIAANRARAARQRQLDRAPPEIVLALPERVWQPDIVWEKSSSSSSGSSGSSARGGRGSGGGGGGGGGGGSGSGSGLAASRSKYSSSPGPAGSSGSSRTSPSPSSRLHISSTAPLSAGFGGPGGYEQGHGHGEGLEAVLPNLASAGTGTGTNKQVGRSRSSTMMSSMTNTTAQSMYTAQTSHTFPAVHSDTSTPMPTPTQRSAASASTVHPRDRSRSSSPVTSTSTHGTYGTHDVQPSGSAAESSRRLSVSRSQGRLRENSAPLSGRYDHRTHANAHTRYPSVESHSPSRLPAIPASTMPHRSQQVQPQAQPQPHVNKRYYAQDECAICMDDFQPGQIVRILPCGHVFHKDECDEWLMKWRKLCPTCRADVTLPARAMAGSTITPVLLRDAQGNETLTAEPAAMGMGMDEDDIERQQWTTPLAPLRVFGRAVRERGGAIWGWMRGTRGRGEGERERLVPRPNEDEI